mmetsp:Transcript_12796/g.23252  ORF Transcript_12796/g.23252 Transcript_12796/m.23252 type:complete len:183 (-) Transcript_12796:265-813(-)
MNMFACVFPGRPISTEFKQVSENRFLLGVPKPAQIREFAITILQPNKIPEGYGVTVYFSLPPFRDWQYIGAISKQMPSQIFSVPWRGTIPNSVEGVQLGASIETQGFIENLHPQSTQEEEKKLISSVQGIAKDLYNFLGSFAKTTDLGEMLIMPVKSLDLWLKKFEAKHKKDPYFWLKNTSA